MTRLIGAVSILIRLCVAVSPFSGTGNASELDEPEDVVFVSRLDGSEQRYIIMLPDGFRSSVPHDLLIALHGHGADRWQFVNDPRPECLGARLTAAERNMIFVSPDYRARTSWMGPAAEADLRQILDDLHGRFRIRDVIISGGSMGATSALTFAAMHPDCVDGVVAMNGTANLLEYTGFPEAIAASYGGSKTEVPEVYRERSAELFPERLTMPVAATTGGRDTLVPPDSVLRLAGELKRRQHAVLSLHRPEGGHDTNLEDTSAAFRFVLDELSARHKSNAVIAAKPLASDATIVCLGDSVTGVYYHTGGIRAYPEMLEIAVNAGLPDANRRVINAGISGHTTNEGLARLDTDVLQHQPALVTISFGLNDMVRVPPDQFRSNLEQLIRRCRERQSDVMLCTPNAVINTSGRPISNLVQYCDIIRSVGHDHDVPVCDQFAVGERLKSRAPWTWRLTMSDEIHPNMDGHKRMAEELCRCITSLEISLDAVGPPQPILRRTMSQIAAGKQVRVLVMEPVAAIVSDAFHRIAPGANIEVSVWPVAAKSLAQIEQEAKDRVRAMKPDLVVLAVPPAAAADSDEQFVHAFSWIMNWSLSFGHQEWDCFAVHPSVFAADSTDPRAELIRRLVRAQHLALTDRDSGAAASAEEILQKSMAALAKGPDSGQ